MSNWDAYIDNLVSHSKDSSGTEHIDKACIIGLDNGAAWTSAAHAKSLNLSADEARTIADAFKRKDFSSFTTSGIYCESKKYQFLRELDKAVFAKAKGSGGLTLQSSKSAVVIAHTVEGGQHGCTNKAVGIIVDYLESLNM